MGSGSGAGIVQRYIERALLADGFKFDLRCYLLVARTQPKYLAFYHTGYCRLTLQRSSATPNDASTDDDLFMHLTNASIQKKHPLYETMKEQQVAGQSAIPG